MNMVNATTFHYNNFHITFIARRLAPMMIRKSLAGEWLRTYIPVQDNTWIDHGLKWRIVAVCPEVARPTILVIKASALTRG